MKMLALLTWLYLWASNVKGFEGTTSFDSILVAHPSPTICPPATGMMSYEPDANYIACCDNWFGRHTLTTGLGPGSKPVFACCLSGYTCTAPVSLMKDWSIDSNGDLQTRDLSDPPTPTAAAVTTPPITAAPSRSTGTISQPGATPIATSNGVIIYVSNDNNNNNNNQVNIGSGGSTLSAGAIAGITVACTIVTAITAVLGVWYARQRNKLDEKAAKTSLQGPTPTQALQAGAAGPRYQVELSGQP